MSRKKIKFHLEPGVIVPLLNSLSIRNDPKHTLELEDFRIEPYRAEWRIKLGTGELIEGRVGDQRPLPFWEGSWICLHIPLIVHRKDRRGSLCPEFIISVPEHIVIDLRKA